MSVFNNTMGKNMVKLTLIAIGALSSTLGLRTELAIILGDIVVSTWIAIGWVGVIIAVLSYYKTKHDVELVELREFREYRRMLGIPTTTPDKQETAVLLNEVKI